MEPEDEDDGDREITKSGVLLLCGLGITT